MFCVLWRIKFLFVILFAVAFCCIASSQENSINGWYKSSSDSRIQAVKGGINWSPVNKPTTIHKYFDPVDLNEGDVITFSMKWESNGRDGSYRNSQCAFCDPTSQGEGISDRYLRCLAGTGDFRVGFFEATDKVGNGSLDGVHGNEESKKFNDYRGFQFRMHPHLSYDYYEQEARLIEEKDDGGGESHINISLWTRRMPGKYGLMSDEAQEYEHSGFSKERPWGTQPQSWGPNMPFGEARDLIVEIKVLADRKYQVKVTLNENPAPLLEGVYHPAFQPKHFDTIAITYTNQSRRYKYVEITDFNVTRAEASTAVRESWQAKAPNAISLCQSYPNPFNASTTIEFNLIENAPTILSVYDVQGKQVAELLNQDLAAGTHRVLFDAGALSSGVYFYKLQTNTGSEIKRMLLLK